MTEEVPALSEILERNKGAFGFPITVDTSKMESLLLSMFSEMQQMKNEIASLKEEISKKADSDNVEKKISEHDEKIEIINNSLISTKKEVDALNDNLATSLDKATMDSRLYAQSLVDELRNEKGNNVTFINQVVKQEEPVPVSTFESTRPATLLSPKYSSPMRPGSAPKLPFELPNRILPKAEQEKETQKEKTPEPSREKTPEQKQPQQEPQEHVSSREKAQTRQKTPEQTQQQQQKQPEVTNEQHVEEFRVPTPQDFKRMTPEEASQFLADAAGSLTPEETGRLAVEMSEHVKDKNVENIFVNLAQKLTPRTTQRIIAEVSTYVDDTVSAKILSAMSSQLSEDQIAKMIKEISTRIAEEETSRIVSQLSNQFEKEDAVSIVIRMCDKMTPQQTSAIVTMLAMNMSPEESAQIMKLITSKVVPEKTVSIAAEMNRRVDENEGKVTELQMKSIKSARDVAERASRTVSPVKSERTKIISPQPGSQKETERNETISPEAISQEASGRKSPEVISNLNIMQKVEIDNLEQRVTEIERTLQDLNAVVLDMHTEVMHPTDGEKERREKLVELFDELSRAASSQSQRRRPGTNGTKLDSAASSAASSSRKALKDTLDHLFSGRNTEGIIEEDGERHGSEDKGKDGDAQSLPPKPQAPMINTDELLDQFLDVTHAELEQMKHEIAEDTQKSVKGLETVLRQMITKVGASQDVNQKKFATQISELTAKINSSITDVQKENTSTFDKLNVTIAQLNERLSTADKRIEEMSAASKIPPPIQKLKINEDGLVNMQPIIDQINSQCALVSDMNSRLNHLDKREVVHPTAFQQVVARLDADEQKIDSYQKQIDSATEIANEAKQALQDYTNYQASEEGQRPFKEIQEKFDATESEIKKIVDGNVKMNKDLTGARAAINTLRSHSEETAGAVEEIKRLFDNIREENQTTDKKMKTVVQFAQAEVANTSEKIKDVSRSVERTDDKVDELAQKIVELQNRFNELSKKPHDKSITERSHSELPRIVSKQTVDRVTSPIPEPEIDATQSFVSTSSLDSLRNISIFPTAPQNTSQDLPAAPQVTQPQTQNRLSAASLPQLQENVESQQFEPQWRAPSSSASKQGNLIPKTNTTNVLKETVISSVDQKKFAEIASQIGSLQTSLSNERSDIEEMMKRIVNLQETKADKDELKTIFEQFRIAMGELNSRILSVRKLANSKVDQSKIDEIINMIPKSPDGDDGNPAAEVRCLLCGNVRKVRQETTTEKDKDKEERSSMPREDPGEQCFVYGDGGELFMGRNSNGKPVVTKHPPILAPLQPPKK